jgi:hypothetical protein
LPADAQHRLPRSGHEVGRKLRRVAHESSGDVLPACCKAVLRR